MMLYFKNTYVAWEGAGWYILSSKTPTWSSQWEKAESIEELNQAYAKNKKTAYITRDVCEKLEDK